jgi:hypothetical protein
MNGGTISGNISDGSRGGGGVYSEGTFTMNGGTISGNTVNNNADGGGGVYAAAFTMNGGTISGNTAAYFGGGVLISNGGTFIKSGTGGIIYGSNAPEGQANRAQSDGQGHAVYSFSGIGQKRNTTARISTAMASRVTGQAGGWE